MPIVSLYKAFNASIERGDVMQSPRQSYKTLAAEAVEFSNAQNIQKLTQRLARIEVLVERLAQNAETAPKMPQNRLEMPLKTILPRKQGNHTKKGTKR